MDRNDPPIIKSGARHSVQISQGTKNAKSVRNVVTSAADAPLEERMVSAEDAPQRAAAVLQQGVTQEQQVGQESSQSVVLEPTQVGGASVLVDTQAAGVAGAGVVVDNPAQQQAPQSGPVVAREERAAQEARAAKAQPDGEHRIQIEQDKAPADTQGVIVEANRSQENRQRIEQIQAQTNRIRIENAQQQAVDVEHAQLGERVRHAHEVTPADEAAGLAPVPQEPAQTLDKVPGPTQAAEPAALPPEVAANLGQAAPTDAKESALMARLRALKSNMSVTENRLTKLKTPETPQS